MKFDDFDCLILDQRIIDVINSQTYEELEQLAGIRYQNANNNYLNYLSLINRIAKELQTRGENIEQFLFCFGNNLKG